MKKIHVCTYFYKRITNEIYKSRIGKNALMFTMNDIESTDIDWEDDFKIAELLHKQYSNVVQ